MDVPCPVCDGPLRHARVICGVCGEELPYQVVLVSEGSRGGGFALVKVEAEQKPAGEADLGRVNGHRPGGTEENRHADGFAGLLVHVGTEGVSYAFQLRQDGLADFLGQLELPISEAVRDILEPVRRGQRVSRRPPSVAHPSLNGAGEQRQPSRNGNAEHED